MSRRSDSRETGNRRFASITSRDRVYGFGIKPSACGLNEEVCYWDKGYCDGPLRASERLLELQIGVFQASEQAFPLLNQFH